MLCIGYSTVFVDVYTVFVYVYIPGIQHLVRSFTCIHYGLQYSTVLYL